MLESNLILTNYYHFECIRRGKKIWEELVKNLITTEGLNDILSKYLKGSTYTAAWYVGLVNNAAFSAFAAGDTAAQINGTNGWDEFTDYDEATREVLTLGTPSGGSVDNSASKASFTIGSGGGTLKGAFVCSVSTKSGTTGVLYGEGAFTANRTVVDDDVLNVTITLTSTSG